MLNWVHVWTPSCPVHDLNILLVQKGCCVTCCMGRGIVLDVHIVTSKHPRRPWQHLIPQDLDVPMPVHGSIHHDQLTPLPMVDCTPYHDWRATISIIRLDASINQPLPSPTPHPNPTVTVVKGEPGLITEDAVSPLSGVPHFVPPPPLTAASPGLQSEPRTSGWNPRPISGDQISEWFELTSASQISGSSAFADEEPRWSGSF